MPPDALLVLGALLLATLPLAAARGWSRGRLALIAGLLLAGMLGVAWAHRGTIERPPTPEDTATARPVQVDADGYVGSNSCLACHPGQHASWRDSYHSSMTQLATPETVIGAFDGRVVDFNEHRYLLTRSGDEFFFTDASPGIESARTRHRVVMTSGSHNKQVYWFETGDTRNLGQLPIYWLPEEQRWVPRRAGFLSDPSRPELSEDGRWNHTCIRCHTTHGRGRLDIATGAADTQAAEFGISCESCHGPGGAHVAANRDPLRRYARHLRGDDGGDDLAGDPTIVNPARLSADRASQVCGQCHSYYEFESPDDALRWSAEGFRYRPGDDLQATRILVRNDPDPEHPRLQEFLQRYTWYLQNRFWPDGAVRTTGREYNAMLETPCAQGGELSCLSCHQMHPGPDDARAPHEWADDQLHAGADGDRACLSCHPGFADDVEAHTHHAPDSAGSACMNCHMPHTSYGLLRAIRSHVVETPSVAGTLATGRPNGCNMCHLDRTQGWVAEQLHDWYAQPIPELDADHANVAASLLWLLRGDAHQRALMAWAFGWEPAREASGEDWSAPHLARLLEDPYDAVRFIAARSLRRLPGQAALDYDPLSGPLGGLGARVGVVRAWEQTAHRPAPELLIGERGELLEDAVRAYLAQRDDRPVYLSE